MCHGGGVVPRAQCGTNEVSHLEPCLSVLKSPEDSFDSGCQSTTVADDGGRSKKIGVIRSTLRIHKALITRGKHTGSPRDSRRLLRLIYKTL